MSNIKKAIIVTLIFGMKLKKNVARFASIFILKFSVHTRNKEQHFMLYLISDI